jgi:murein DD-endopeptidase MepM/ murein hydrolase activator NlpD
VPPATAPPATPSAPPAATAEAPAATPEVAPKSVAIQPVRPATDSKTAPPAATKPQPRPPDERPAFTLAPGDRTAMASPGRMQPLIPFAQAKGRLPLPAQGKRVISFGDKTQRGKFEGIAIETRHGAQVTAPSDGWVLYAGEFRTFGQLLIINAGGGYTIILSNLAQIDVPVGQFVVAGEPVGTMQAAPRAPAGRVPDNPPVLYVEFRKDRNPIDPDPWWIEPGRRQASLAGPAQLALAAAPGAPVPGAPAPGAPAPGAPAP